MHTLTTSVSYRYASLQSRPGRQEEQNRIIPKIARSLENGSVCAAKTKLTVDDALAIPSREASEFETKEPSYHVEFWVLFE